MHAKEGKLEVHPISDKKWNHRVTNHKDSWKSYDNQGDAHRS